jgi:hypothetical protein
MILPLKITDWSMDQYELTLQVLSVILILIMLVYIGMSSKDTE